MAESLLKRNFSLVSGGTDNHLVLLGNLHNFPIDIFVFILIIIEFS